MSDKYTREDLAQMEHHNVVEIAIRAIEATDFEKLQKEQQRLQLFQFCFDRAISVLNLSAKDNSYTLADVIKLAEDIQAHSKTVMEADDGRSVH